MSKETRDQLLYRYIRDGIPGVREYLDGLCPGCIAEAVVDYVQAECQRVCDEASAYDREVCDAVIREMSD